MKIYRIANRLILASNKLDAVIKLGLPPIYIEEAMRIVKPAKGNLFQRGWYSGTTQSRFKRIGPDACINVRAGEFWRNACGNEYKIDRRNARKELIRLNKQKSAQGKSVAKMSERVRG